MFVAGVMSPSIICQYCSTKICDHVMLMMIVLQGTFDLTSHSFSRSRLFLPGPFQSAACFKAESKEKVQILKDLRKSNVGTWSQIPIIVQSLQKTDENNQGNHCLHRMRDKNMSANIIINSAEQTVNNEYGHLQFYIYGNHDLL